MIVAREEALVTVPTDLPDHKMCCLAPTPQPPLAGWMMNLQLRREGSSCLGAQNLPGEIQEQPLA